MQSVPLKYIYVCNPIQSHRIVCHIHGTPLEEISNGTFQCKDALNLYKTCVQWLHIFGSYWIYVVTSRAGMRAPRASKRGSRTNRMKPTCDEDLVTFSRSMNGATGRPSNFSTSLWTQKIEDNKNIQSSFYPHAQDKSLLHLKLTVRIFLVWL